jgi:hypothetical protein
MLLLPLHPACAMQRLPELLADGPTRGMVYCYQAKAVVKLSDECMRLLSRIVDGSRSFDVLDCVAEKAWESDKIAEMRESQRLLPPLSLADAQRWLKLTAESSLQLPEALSSCLRLCRSSDVDGDGSKMNDLVDCIQEIIGNWCWRR